MVVTMAASLVRWLAEQLASVTVLLMADLLEARWVNLMADGKVVMKVAKMESWREQCSAWRLAFGLVE
jgi:hypothetical protein